jgi:uncharacterized protein (DUF58 family)
MSLLRFKRRPQDADDLFDEAFMAKLEYLDIVSKKAFGGANRGERRSKKLGAGLEFADHRRYSPGDDFKHIDWNVYARMGKLLVRLFEEEEDLTVTIMMDTSQSMAVGDRQKFDYARRLTAALGYITLSNMDRLSIVPFGADAMPALRPSRGKAQIFRVFDFLRGLKPSGKTDLHRSVKAFVHQRRRRGLVVLISDFYAPEGFEDALNLLRYHRFEPLVLQLTDAREMAPDVMGDLVIVDCETGEQRELTITPRLLAKYRQAFEGFCHELEGYCRERQLSYFRTPIQTSFEDLMLRIFRAGGFLR